CSTVLSTEESFTISFAEDWRAPYLAFFVGGTLPTNSKLAYKLKKTIKRYFPFHTWGLDLIGTIHPPSDGYIWILTATEYFTKWVEAIPLRKATGAAVSNFIREYIVCRFGIPYKMVTDNGTPFVNKQYQGSWSVHQSDALWAYRTSPRSATGFSPYSLVYGSEAISPVEITIPTARIAAVNDLEWDAKTCADWRLLDLEAADERRMEA
ncbi:unnamed protein product, partial [Prunus brigantina]